MKKLLLLLLVIAISTSACSGPKTIAREETSIVTGYDFSEYTEQGFLFTPEQYLGDYNSIGMITVTLWPDVNKRIERVPIPGQPGRHQNVEKFSQGVINVEKAINEIYNKAVTMGADAITRFDVNATSRENGTLLVTGVEISGFAIKRK